MAHGAGAEEQERSRGALLRVEMTQLWRDVHPEAEAEHARHVRIHTLVNPLGERRDSSPQRERT